jgi:hypothetical protein
MKTFSRQVLEIFRVMRRDRLDLHVLFEAAGNNTDAREQVLDAVDDLVREGMIENSGADFYTITDKGKAALAMEIR